ncbi:MAG: beta-Ala-His dipeptidase [Lachnospiraceae bacterium]|nr:beta-Ala-His dipeptidase [Lachnospiraceae bacterium]
MKNSNRSLWGRAPKHRILNVNGRNISRAEARPASGKGAETVSKTKQQAFEAQAQQSEQMPNREEKKMEAAVEKPEQEKAAAGSERAEDVIDRFKEIAAIPHGSGNIRQISDHLAAFAREHDLKYRQDEVGNVIIFKPASESRKNAETLILQGHMDMVCEKRADKKIDMEKEPITLVFDPDGDTLHADGTTLGADDGIAVAMMMAILADDTLEHPALECVFTVNEETDMGGAMSIDCSDLQGRRMLNLDSEDEGIFTAGCAGCAHVTCHFGAEYKNRDGIPFTVSVSGLRGGHSGEMIQLGRANADQLLGRILHQLLKKQAFHLISAEGGTKDNAIPRNADAVLLLPEDAQPDELAKTVHAVAEEIADEYAQADPDIKVEYTIGEPGSYASARGKDTRRIVGFLSTFPYGVQEYVSAEGRDPQTSLNLGILETKKEENDGAGCEVTAVFLIRSSINSQRDLVAERLSVLTEAFGGKCDLTATTPAWPITRNSAYRDRLVEIYRDQAGSDAVVNVIHAGLECGVFGQKIKGLDAVSIGPDTHAIHTAEESVSLGSVSRLYAFVKKVLQEI